MQLYENKYGISENPTKFSNMLQALCRHDLLILLLSDEPLDCGFTLYSNYSGTKTKLNDDYVLDNFIIHHLNGNHKDNSKINQIKMTLRTHSKFHNRVIKNVIDFLKNDKNVNSCLKTSYEKYIDAYNKPLTYNSVSERFKAYEDFFRDFRDIAKSNKLNLDIDKILINTFDEMIKSGDIKTFEDSKIIENENLLSGKILLIKEGKYYKFKK